MWYRLAAYVYEYLVISGATKTAEVFKEEVLSVSAMKFCIVYFLIETFSKHLFQNVPNGAIKPSEVGPGFLQNWWM